MPHCLIIGNGAAGNQAALAARKQDPQAEITVISRENRFCYYRYLLPQLLAGKKDQSNMLLHPESFYREKNINFLLGRVVGAVNTSTNKVILADGQEIGYDSLLIASGSLARKPSWPGSDLDGVVTLREWDDIPVIESKLPRSKDIVVVGGGLLGIEFAWAFRELGRNVSYLIKEDRFWPQMLDMTASSIIHRKLYDAGVNLMTNESVKEIRGESGRVVSVLTESGKEIPCQMVGAAIGAVPETAFLKDSGIVVDRGVLADDHLRANLPNVFAAGDVAQAWDVVAGEHRVNTSWLNAHRQGDIAGANMAGGTKVFAGGMSYNAMEIYGISFVSMGTPNSTGDGYSAVSKVGSTGDDYKKIVFRDGVLVGATLLGNTAQARSLEDLIKRQVKAGDRGEEMLDPGFDFKSLTIGD
jgi:nitrite reductase (NADH) large subunit